MVLVGLGRWEVVLLDSRAIWALGWMVWVVQGGLGHWWVVMFDRRAILASA